MKRIFFIVVFILAVFLGNVNAQDKVAGTLALGMRGEPLHENPYTEVQGDPYLVSDWVSGFVILESGQKATANLKLDIVSNSLLFEGKTGETLQLKSAFSGFTLTPVLFDASNLRPLVFVDNLPGQGQTNGVFYQQIAIGKISLYKNYRKVIDQQPGTNYTSSNSRRFKLLQSYLVLKNSQLTEIQPGKKAFAKLFEDHAAEYDQFLKSNSISFKSDADLQKLFGWYNSL